MILNHRAFLSPIGWILMASTQKGICMVQLLSDEDMRQLGPGFTLGGPGTGQCPFLKQAEAVLIDYLTQGSPIPPDMPLDLTSATPFQLSVWNALRQIPHGETRTYTQVALSLGKPKSARAVAQACAKNPVAILVPCHRVVPSNGGVGGYSAGVHMKKALLELEAEGSG